MEMRNTARVSLSHFACFVCLALFVCLFCFVSLMWKLRDNLPLQINVQMSKFYWAGYLRSRSFPPPPPKKKILLSLQYISNYIKKNHPDATRSVHTLEHFSKLCLKMHQIASQCTFISKYFRGSMLPDPLGTSWPSVPRDFSPKQ